MGILAILDITVLKASGTVSSALISLTIADAFTSGKHAIASKQVLGFVTLFLIALLVYAVV